MGTHDDHTLDSEQKQLDALIRDYRAKHGHVSDAVIGALIYQALSEAGRVNLTGTKLETVSVGTRLHGMRLVMALDATDQPGQSEQAPGQDKPAKGP